MHIGCYATNMNVCVPHLTLTSEVLTSYALVWRWHIWEVIRFRQDYQGRPMKVQVMVVEAPALLS